jgi:predicted Zn-dependent protease
MRSKTVLAIVMLVAACAGIAAGAEKRTLEGYAEWREGGALIVDGQRVRLDAKGRFKGNDQASSFAAIPLGYEVKADVERLPDGSWLARRVEAKPNRDALFESDVRETFDELERKFRQAGVVYEEDDDGKRQEYGRLRDRGRDVERARRVVERLVPPYYRRELRVYVVENEDWNAMAGPNGSIFVFSGLLRNVSDDELAVILGHELAHVTHEHSRREMKKGLLPGLLAAGVTALADEMDSKPAKIAVQAVAILGGQAWQNAYSRRFEDQADRVGLRYAYEAGYDVSCAPALWKRIAARDGDLPKAVHFFLGDHSRSEDRAVRMTDEVRWNYSTRLAEVR